MSTAIFRSTAIRHSALDAESHQDSRGGKVRISVRQNRGDSASSAEWRWLLDAQLV